MRFERCRAISEGLEFLLEFALDGMVLGWKLASRDGGTDESGLMVSKMRGREYLDY